VAEARAHFAEAIAISEDKSINITSDLLTTFVFNAAYLERDAAAARRYWDLFESKTPTHFGVDYWLSRAALHFVEDHPLEAHDAWNVGAVLARELPIAGAYEFDRDRYRLIRDLLNSAPDPQPSLSSAKLLRMPPRDRPPQPVSPRTTPGGNFIA
jgi:hypothetical protein